MSAVDDGVTVGVLGGTGAQGRGLAVRWAVAGLDVVIGSRDAERASAAAAEIAEVAGVDGARVRGADNVACAMAADVVLVAVPWDAHDATLTSVSDQLVGKVVIDCVNPLGFDGKGPFRLDVEEGSAAERAQALLPESQVVGAFHNVSAVLLADLAVTSVDTDVLVLGEDRESVAMAQALAERIPGVRALHAGRLRNGGQVEALTANLIAMNRRYKTHTGIRVTGHGLPE